MPSAASTAATTANRALSEALSRGWEALSLICASIERTL